MLRGIGVKTIVSAALVAVLSVCLGVPAFASELPLTGDNQLMPIIMGGLIGVSLLLLVVYFVLSAKKKK